MTEREWLGSQGHLCVDCRWHLHTHVGGWCVSTVGEYYPRNSETMETVGGGNTASGGPVFYETMVFALEREDQTVWEADTMERYATRDEAQAGHAAMCERYEGRA